VERAHVICLDGDRPTALCIHFDAAKLPLPRLREMVRAAGAEITERYGHAIWQVTGISHERRARTVSDALCALPGVVQASASTSGSVRVEYDRRMTTEEQVDFAAEQTIGAVKRLRELSPLYEMVLEGIDLSKIQWQSDH
jgi:Cd2+/Zn2+-exporting ATPase